MVVCDTIARTITTGEVPIGIVTAIVGAPYLLFMLRKRKKLLWRLVHMLSVKNLYYSYEDFDVLKDVNFDVEKQQLCALFGPNGTGKSTLFKCITKLLDTKNKGEILVNNKNIAKNAYE